MMKKTCILVFSLCCFLFAAGIPAVTADDAVSQKDIENIVKSLKGIKISGLMYLSYQNGESSDQDYNTFALKRGYLQVEKTILPWFSARITTDIAQEHDTFKDPTTGQVITSSDYNGSIVPRIKYLYGKFSLASNSFLTKPNIEVGQVHMPWLDFEEHINYYRLQDPMFIERNSIINSADVGVTFATLLGGTMDDEYQKTVNDQYPGRYGSASFGVYNGGGYHASEQNQNKVVEGRITIRPLPDVIPGLQFSYFGTTGNGNKDTEPDWNTNLGFISYECQLVTLTGSYYKGKGSQGGGDENDKDGYSMFGELKAMEKVSFIGRFDHFDPNTDMEDDANNRIIGGVAYMLDKLHNNMVLADYENVSYEENGKSDDHRLQLTLQVGF